MKTFLSLILMVVPLTAFAGTRLMGDCFGGGAGVYSLLNALWFPTLMLFVTYVCYTMWKNRKLK